MPSAGCEFDICMRKGNNDVKPSGGRRMVVAETDGNSIRRIGRESVSICQSKALYRETLSSVSSH